MITRTLSDYTQEPEGDGFRYRLKRTNRGFVVVPFAGMWRASNGVFGVIAATADEAARRWIGELPTYTAAQ
jgi:hypothetical protein